MDHERLRRGTIRTDIPGMLFINIARIHMWRAMEMAQVPISQSKKLGGVQMELPQSFCGGSQLRQRVQEICHWQKAWTATTASLFQFMQAFTTPSGTDLIEHHALGALPFICRVVC